MRVRGSFWRTGWWMTRSTMRSTTCVGGMVGAGIAPLSPFLAVDSGWATLQLSR